MRFALVRVGAKEIVMVIRAKTQDLIQTKELALEKINNTKQNIMEMQEKKLY